MSTYRERREAKAERLREWADGREQKAGEAYERSREISDRIPFGQPILVGHHSERGHRADIRRIDSAMGQSVEHSAKANEMRGRADNIEREAKRAIYDDDPDAVERLREKIAALEGERERMKAANAEYRKAHREELKAMSAYERRQAVPFPSYALSNIGGVLSTTRARLARLVRLEANGGKPADRTITARFDGKCADCDAPLAKGDQIRYSRSAGARCAPACG